MVLSLEQNTFIVMSYYRNGTLQNGEWVYSINACKEEFFAKFPNCNIVEANLIAHIRRVVNRFVATGSVEKGKSVGRPPVNEEIVEDLRQRIEQIPKTSLRKLSLQADVPLSTCQKIVRKNLNLYPYKITTLQELRPGDSERRLEYCNWFLNNLNDDRAPTQNPQRITEELVLSSVQRSTEQHCNNVSEAKVKGPIKLTGEKTGSRPFRDRNRKRRRRINFGTSVASDQQDSPFQDYISVSINIPSILNFLNTHDSLESLNFHHSVLQSHHLVETPLSEAQPGRKRAPTPEELRRRLPHTFRRIITVHPRVTLGPTEPRDVIQARTRSDQYSQYRTLRGAETGQAAPQDLGPPSPTNRLPTKPEVSITAAGLHVSIPEPRTARLSRVEEIYPLIIMDVLPMPDPTKCSSFLLWESSVYLRKEKFLTDRGCVCHGKQGNGRPFRERPFICHKENWGTGLAEVRGVDAGSVIQVAMKNGSLPKEPYVEGPTQSLVDPFMTCDPGRRVSRRLRWKASVSSVAIRRTQAGALHP
ncbi:hypothetical protein GEV33_012076 [Tenebrio molitor]|uniref:DUF4817 domain-containing protein n=1 Tax=Tenebrio molitor TaxID=7067 RepID=A0A8J6H2R4_TENMO|nr:hypothetical protein GEV33_012076 [Tenebrio molitor]